MGGNALKEYGVERLSKDEFLDLQVELRRELLDMGVCPKYTHFVKSYEDKVDFGDMDVVINKGDGSTQQLLLKTLDEREVTYKANGSVYSTLAYYNDKPFQVDLIFQKDKDFEFSCHYFDYNDLGNLIGRVAHKAGFKFGHDGLWYVLRDGDYQVGKICITKDFFEAIDFLGFDVMEYRCGFKSLEDIFSFVVSNTFFDPESYKLENRSRYARIRDKKRPTYQKFLEFIQNTPASPNGCSKLYWLTSAMDEWPAFATKYDELQEKYKKKKELASKFNGNIVREITGLEGKDLGSYITNLKSFYGDMFEEMSPESIRELIQYNWNLSNGKWIE